MHLLRLKKVKPYSKLFNVPNLVTLMFDSVNFRLTRSDYNGADFLSEMPCYITDVSEHHFNDGVVVVTGYLGNLKVSCNEYQIKVKDGSLCKWYLGDNLQTMGRKDTERAVEKLSDLLHLPMDKAQVTRIDVSQNFIMKHPPSVYLQHLGGLKGAARLEEPNTLYYRKQDCGLCFYDKAREQKAKKETLPELYEGRNVLRYEQRYTGRLAKHLGVSEVRASMLYNEAFYINLLNRWRDDYKAIQKINDVQLNFNCMRNKKDLNRMGLLSLVERVGGLNAMMNQITEAQQQGKLNRKQAFDLRQAIKEACEVKDGLVVENEAIAELNKKVVEAVRFYR